MFVVLDGDDRRRINLRRGTHCRYRSSQVSMRGLTGPSVVLTALVVAVVLMWPLVGGLSSTPRGQAVAPSLRKVFPSLIATGSPTFTIRLKGEDFINGARVLLDGARLESSRITSGGTIALAEIDSSLIAVSGEHSVQVVNPNGSASEKGSFSVVDPDPELRIRLSDNAVDEATGVDLALEITGEGFTSKSSKVLVGGTQREKEFISENRISFTVPSSLTDDAAYLPVFIVDNQNGHLSNTEILFVVAATASLESVDPESIEVGSADFRVAVTGSGLKAGARILANGEYLVTTNPEKGLLEATAPGRLRSTPGQLFVRVEQDGTQSSDLPIVVSPTDDPFILYPSPPVIRQGEPSPVVWVVGSGFTAGLHVLVDGLPVDDGVRRRNRTLIKVRLSDDLLSAPGSHSIQVTDAEGRPSNVSRFSVTADVTVETLAGGKHEGFNKENCVAFAETLLRRPSRLVVGKNGEIYLVEYQNHVVRSIDLNSGQVCVVAGTGRPGYSDSGDDPAFAPTFSYPLGIALQSDGSILVSDSGNDVLRRIRGTSTGNLTVETYAGSYDFVEEDGRRTRLNSTRVGLTGFRAGDVSQAAFRKPDDMVAAPDGSIYFSDADNHSIRKIRQDGSKVVIETVAGTGVPGFADGDASKARFYAPTGLALSRDGQFLFVADSRNNRIRRMNLTTRRVETLCGKAEQGNDDGPSFVANFTLPTGLAMDSDGTLYVSEVGAGRIRRVDGSGNVSVVAGPLNSSKNKNRDGSGVESRFNAPRGIAIDVMGRTLYVADLENSAIRRILLPH